jgi:hypothetical protein
MGDGIKKPDKPPEQPGKQQEPFKPLFDAAYGVSNWLQAKPEEHKAHQPTPTELKQFEHSADPARAARLDQTFKETMMSGIWHNTVNQFSKEHLGGLGHHSADDARKDIASKLNPEAAAEIQKGKELAQAGYSVDGKPPPGGHPLSFDERQALGHYQIFNEQLKTYAPQFAEDKNFVSRLQADVAATAESAPKFDYQQGAGARAAAASAGGEKAVKGDSVSAHPTDGANQPQPGGHPKPGQQRPPEGGRSEQRDSADTKAQRIVTPSGKKDEGGDSKSSPRSGTTRASGPDAQTPAGSARRGDGTAPARTTAPDARPLEDRSRGKNTGSGAGAEIARGQQKPAADGGSRKPDENLRGGARNQQPAETARPGVKPAAESKPETKSTVPSRAGAEKLAIPTSGARFSADRGTVRDTTIPTKPGANPDKRAEPLVPKLALTDNAARTAKSGNADTAAPGKRVADGPIKTDARSLPPPGASKDKAETQSSPRGAKPEERIAKDPMQVRRSESPGRLEPQHRNEQIVRIGSKADSVTPISARNPSAVLEALKAARIQQSERSSTLSIGRNMSQLRGESNVGARSFTPSRPGGHATAGDAASGRVIRVPLTDGRSGAGVRGDVPVRIAGNFSTTRGTEGGRIPVDGKTFVSPVRIQDKRYILGTEIALAAVITAASVARHRPDQRGDQRTAPRPDQVQSVRIDQQIGRPFLPQTPRFDGQIGKPLPPAAATSSGDRSSEKTFTTQGRVDKRYITGAEIALSAVLVAGGIARVRREFSQEKIDAKIARGPQENSDGKPVRNPQEKIDAKSGRDPQEKFEVKDLRNPQDKSEKPRPLRPGEMPSEKGTDLKDADYIRLANIIPDQTEEIAKYNPDNPDSFSLKPPEYKVSKQQLKAALEELPSLNILGETDRTAYAKTIEQLADEILAQAEESGEQPQPKKQVLVRPTVLINTGETLVGLAEAYFHDPNLGWLIADLNAENIKQSWIDGKRVVELRSRQQLELPVWQDIEEFYESRRDDAVPENLITIVEQSQVNLELLNSSLSVAMGGGATDGPVTPSVPNTSILPGTLASKLKSKRYGFSFAKFLTDS